jgi:hypothetical protein
MDNRNTVLLFGRHAINPSPPPASSYVSSSASAAGDDDVSSPIFHPPPAAFADAQSVIVEGNGRVEVISSDAAAPDACVDEHQRPDEGAADDDSSSPTPFSADLSLDTPKSYMSATGQ